MAAHVSLLINCPVHWASNWCKSCFQQAPNSLWVDAKYSVYVSTMHGGSWDVPESELVIWVSVLTQECTFWDLRVFLYLPAELLTEGSAWLWMSHTQGHDMCQRKWSKEMEQGEWERWKKKVRQRRREKIIEEGRLEWKWRKSLESGENSQRDPTDRNPKGVAAWCEMPMCFLLCFRLSVKWVNLLNKMRLLCVSGLYGNMRWRDLPLEFTITCVIFMRNWTENNCRPSGPEWTCCGK